VTAPDVGDQEVSMSMGSFLSAVSDWLSNIRWQSVGAMIGGLTGPIGAIGAGWGIYDRWRTRREEARRRGPHMTATVWPPGPHGWMPITIVIDPGEAPDFDVLSIAAKGDKVLFTTSISRPYRLSFGPSEPDVSAATAVISWSNSKQPTVRRKRTSFSRWISSSNLHSNPNIDLSIIARCRFISDMRTKFMIEAHTRTKIDEVQTNPNTSIVDD
jgi:hypothetical protein